MGNIVEPPKPDKPMAPVKTLLAGVLFVASGFEDYD